MNSEHKCFNAATITFKYTGYIKENTKNSEVYSPLANKKQTAYFSTNANAANYPELLMLVKFCFDYSCT
jgi:hypothetical protein